MTVSRNYVRESRIVEKRSPITRVLEGEYVVRAYSVITTDLVVIEAWEPDRGARRSLTSSEHSTITHEEPYGYLGKVTSRVLPADVASLPFGADRSIAVGKIHGTRIREAKDAIRAAFPELVGSICWDGGDARVNLAAYHAAQVTA